MGDDTTADGEYRVIWDLESWSAGDWLSLIRLAEAMRSAIPNCECKDPNRPEYGPNVTASGHAPSELMFLLPAATYLGKKAIDVLGNVVTEWLTKEPKCEHRTVPLYGSDGTVVKIVECELKPHK